MIHWRFGGSTAERTINCPGWRQLADECPEPPESPYAAEGSALHKIMEQAFLEADPIAHITAQKGKTVHGVEIDDDRLDRCLEAWRAVEELTSEHGAFEFEPEVGAEYAEDIGGHADFVAVNEANDRVFVGDFKFGRGFQISPHENAQAKFYAFALRAGSSAADMFMGCDTVSLVIIQPNDRGLPTLRVWDTTVDEINRFEREFTAAVAKAKSDNPPLKTGDHCKFCPASAVCPKRTGDAHRALLLDPEDLDLLSENLGLVAQLRDWITAVEQTALTQLERGAPVPGYKLVQKRAMAKWRYNEDTIYKKLSRKLGGKRAMTVAKLVSPAQAKQIAKKKGIAAEVIDDLTVKQSSGFSIAHEDDKRPEAVAPAALGAALAAMGKTEAS